MQALNNYELILPVGHCFSLSVKGTYMTPKVFFIFIFPSYPLSTTRKSCSPGFPTGITYNN